MHYHIGMLDSIVDLLRNESPIYLDAAPNWAYLKTRDEAVGEDDLCQESSCPASLHIAPVSRMVVQPVEGVRFRRSRRSAAGTA